MHANIHTEGGRGSAERDTRGRLEGSILTISGTQFTVSGNEMRGSRGGATPMDINLTKKK